MRLLFVLRTVNYDRVFEGLLRELLSRGHRIEILLDMHKGGLPDRPTALFDAIREDFPETFSYEMMPARKDPWLRAATGLRFGIDYLRYLEPEYEDAPKLRERARTRVPAILRGLLWLWRGDREKASRRLRRLEAAMPVPEAFTEILRERRPDAVMVSPLVGLGSFQGDYLRAAARLGIPTIHAVASWDNLTNKGILRDFPDLMIVWNGFQVEEAVELHGLPRERVVATGSHTYDHWFAWEPATDRRAFGEKAGLDIVDRDLILYVGSSSFIAPEEAGFVREWLARLRAHPDPRLADAAVIIRPHPQNTREWLDFDPGDPRVVVWPRLGAAPTNLERKTDYFDTIHHSFAVVGVNTSALIETAIVGRPVLTLLHERFAETQGGTLHFAHLAGDGQQGLLTVAEEWDEHYDQLAGFLHDPRAHQERIDGFLRSFVRPYGLDVPAAPRAADAIEELVRRGEATRQETPRLGGTVRTFTPVMRAFAWLDAPRWLVRQVVFKVRDLAGRATRS